MLDSEYGFAQIAKEALNRLGVAWESSEASKSYEYFLILQAYSKLTMPLS